MVCTSPLLPAASHCLRACISYEWKLFGDLSHLSLRHYDGCWKQPRFDILPLPPTLHFPLAVIVCNVYNGKTLLLLHLGDICG